jgi:diaminopimelate epimerase
VHCTKHEGAGNDFLVVLDPDDTLRLSVGQVRLLCDRRRGIGADGIIRVGPGRDGCDLSMELRNADGGEAEMSGNGIRCLAQAAVDAGLVVPAPLHRGHGGGVRTVDFVPGESPGWARASVDMGPVRWGPTSPRTSTTARPGRSTWATRTWSCSGPRWPSVDIAECSGPAAVRLRRRDQRGVDLPGRTTRTGSCSTCGCGSAAPARPWPAAPGSVAAAAAARSWGVVGADGPVRVRNPGGTLEVTLGERTGDPAFLAGPGAQGGRHRHPPGDALLSNVLPGTLIDRSFRERIILVGVVFPGPHPERSTRRSTSWPSWWTAPGPTWWAGWCSGATRPTRPPSSGGARPEEIAALSRTLDADTVVFDDELSPAQQRNLEKVFGRTAIDRTAVILDIFAQNARSPEGKAQVELALLRYRLPRLRGRGGAQPAGRWHRHPGPGRDPARGGPPAPGAAHAPPRGRPARGRPDPRAAAPQPGPRAATASWRWSATPTPASRPCSTR